MSSLILQKGIKCFFIIVFNNNIFIMYMKTKNIINIFYFLTILNYILHYKIQCLVLLLVSHVILYYVLKNDTKAKLISIIASMFLFCSPIIETMQEGLQNECSDEKKEKCKELDKICIEGDCEEKLCTDEKKKECEDKGQVCSEMDPRGCKEKKKKEKSIFDSLKSAGKQSDASSLAHTYKPKKGTSVGSRVVDLDLGSIPRR